MEKKGAPFQPDDFSSSSPMIFHRFVSQKPLILSNPLQR